MSDAFARSTRGALDERNWGLTRRAWFKASGFTDADLTKPVVGFHSIDVAAAANP